MTREKYETRLGALVCIDSAKKTKGKRRIQDIPGYESQERFSQCFTLDMFCDSHVKHILYSVTICFIIEIEVSPSLFRKDEGRVSCGFAYRLTWRGKPHKTSARRMFNSKRIRDH